MKRIFYIYLLAILTSLSSCKNQDWSFDDYGTTTIYFAYQNPVRRLVLGNDEVFDNTLDNQHKCKIMATLGGVYENKTDRIMDFTVDNSLCNNLNFENGDPVVAMPENYYTLSSDKLVIPKGSHIGGVEVQLTDAFFADPNSIKTHYVIPVVISNVQNADAILSGTPIVDNPNRLVTSDWSVQPKDFILYGVKYSNPWDAVYLRRGVDLITKDGFTTTTVRHAQYRENDEVCDFTTVDLNTVAWTLKFDGNQTCDVTVKFSDGNQCELSTTTPGCSVTGTGKFVVKGEKNSFNNKDRDVLYLDYTLTMGDMTYATKDTLVVRDRKVAPEYFDYKYE